VHGGFRDALRDHNGEYTWSDCIPRIAVKADGADHKLANGAGHTVTVSKNLNRNTVMSFWQAAPFASLFGSRLAQLAARYQCHREQITG